MHGGDQLGTIAGEVEQRGPTMRGVGRRNHEPLLGQPVDDHLDVLAGDQPSACDVGDRRRARTFEVLEDCSSRNGHRSIGVERLGDLDETVLQEPDLVEQLHEGGVHDKYTVILTIDMSILG